MEGVSYAESWGRWTDGKYVTLHFCEPLPRRFEMILTARSFAERVGLAVRVRVGRNRWVNCPIHNKPSGPYHISLSNPDMEDTIVFRIATTIVPSKFWPGKSNDNRALGLALGQLKIITHTTRSGE
jgi:phosphoglycerol transferase